jgi:2-polyprenyl-3-methyl-5-hydroxy-6-metoxy-1,4-benzoquinol methylase
LESKQKTGKRSERWLDKTAIRLRFLNKWKSTGKLLEIGCGWGDFLNAASREGWKTTGIEISGAAAQKARDLYGLEVLAGPVETEAHKLPAGDFDVVWAANLLEHLTSPAIFFRAVQQLLRRGGVLFASTLNYDSWAFRMSASQWQYCSRPQVHRFIFGPDTLNKYCGENHLKIVRLKTFGFRFVSKRKGGKWLKFLIRPAENLIGSAAHLAGKGHRIEILAEKRSDGPP